MEEWIVSRDGVEKARFPTEAQAVAYLHRAQGHSVEWATRYEGWKISQHGQPTSLTSRGGTAGDATRGDPLPRNRCGHD